MLNIIGYNRSRQQPTQQPLIQLVTSFQSCFIPGLLGLNLLSKTPGEFFKTRRLGYFSIVKALLGDDKGKEILLSDKVFTP